MAQKLIGAVGIVGVLIMAGLLISNTGTNLDIASLAIKAGVTIGIAFGILGIIGIIITLLKRATY